MISRRFLVIGGILLMGLLLAGRSSAQRPDQECIEYEYFPETRHRVCNQFLAFLNARGGVELFGYPITPAFEEDGRVVQYFQRVRMEYHPELPPAYQVQLGLLGDLFAPADKTARISPSDKPKSNDPARRYFPETGHTVQFSFLKFFNENGGVDNFGYPVTEFFLEEGRVVQYFQRAKMEWDPNHDDIKLHLLGEMWVDQDKDRQRMRYQFAPAPDSVVQPPTVSGLHATASVRDAFAGQADDQTVWVYVNDQNGQPVEGAEVTLVALFFPGGRSIPMDATDRLGHTETTFQISDLTPGQFVILEAQVLYGNLTTRARAFFLVWW